MSTANFRKFNHTNGYYVISDSYTDDEGQEVYVEFRDIVEDLQGFCPDWLNPDPDRSGKVLSSDDQDVYVPSSCVTIGGSIFVRSGYYQDYNLDYDIHVDDWQLSEYQDSFSMAVCIANYMQENGCIPETPEALNETIDIVEAAIDDLAKRLEKFCADSCEYQLRRIGTFSNGSAVYERV